MKVFLAGASGVIGRRLVPLLVAAGHEVTGMTRSVTSADTVRELGAEAVVCDVYDAEALTAAVVAATPDMVMHQLTDLPDNASDIREFAAANARIRSAGTRNLVAAAQAAEASRFLAQSIAWTPLAGSGVIEEHERMVLDVGGVVLRYGQFWGPGTYHPDGAPGPPRIHVDAAAARTMDLLDAPSGVLVVVDVDVDVVVDG